MTQITTYATLQTAVAEHLGRDATDSTDIVVANLESFISLAERKFARRLRVKELMRRATAPISEETELLPNNLAALISVSYMSTGSAWKPLEYKTMHQLRRNFSYAGTPEVYSIVGHEILFGPFVSPDVDVGDAATMELIYWQKPTALSDSVTTNEVLTSYPEIYLYATLVEAARFIVSDQLPVWEKILEESIFEANEQTEENNSEGVTMSGSDAAV